MTPQQGATGFMGIGMLSSLFGGISQYKEGQAEKSAYDYNADITLQNMRAQMVASQEKYSQLVGRQASSYARAGVDIASGSPLLMMAATAGRGGQEAEQIEQAGTEEAALQQYYGRIAAWKGTLSSVGDFLGGMTGSLSNYYKMFPPTPGATPSASPEGVMG
jgi:hypothetical protein